MIIVVSPVGEFVEILKGVIALPYPHNFGRHSCGGGEVIIHEVSVGWRAIACRSCNFRQLIPSGALYREERMIQFFTELGKLDSAAWSSPARLKEVLDTVISNENINKSRPDEISRVHPGPVGIYRE